MGYRTISRPLVDELTKIKQPVTVTLLRPSTDQALDAHLEETTRTHGAGHYHVLHFDAHGGLLTYQAFQNKAAPSRYVFHGRYGRADIAPYEGERAYLSLKNERDERTDLVEASEVAQLLLKHRIPMVILNACQSGKYSDKDESSIGSRLIEAGVQTVLAMGYSVTVSAAERLMPVLYRALLAKSSLPTALCQGRQALAKQKQRRVYHNEQIDLEDWVLPIVYQNQEVRFAIQEAAEESPSREWGRGSEHKAPLCPKCATPLRARGKQERTLQGNGGQSVTLSRTYGTCPKCGEGLFPPG